MQERPHLAILDRDFARATVAEHFAEQVALLRDLANYGSNLVFRAYESSKKDTADVLVCGALLKQIVSMVDSVEVQLSAGIVHAGFLSARAAFEASIYLEWILLSDRDHKARCYVVGNYRDERLWALRVIHGTPEKAALDSVTSTFGLDLLATHPELAAGGPARLAEVNAHLAKPELAAVDKEFEQRRGKKKYDVEWYDVAAGVKSIRQVAAAVKREGEYDFFYSKGSEVTHSGKLRDHVQIGEAQSAQLKPVRNLEDIHHLVSFTAGTAIRTFRTVLSAYRPGELDAFARKYLEDWKAPYFSVKSVVYKDEPGSS